MAGERVDLAIVGAGIAGTYLADRVRTERPDWSVAIFERTQRVGGRLRSVHVSGAEHAIELGGMRFMTSHRRVASIVNDFSLPTHPFDRTGGEERVFLRGTVADGPADPAGGRNYGLDRAEEGRSALDLWRDAFDQVVPDGANLDHEAFVRLRATGEYRGRRLSDWSIGEALQTVLSPEGWQYVRDAFGYDSGIRAFNAPDFIEFLGAGGDPTAEARTPDEGMDVLPRCLAERFQRSGGTLHQDHELTSIEIHDGRAALDFENGVYVDADRVILTAAVPALERLATRSPALRMQTFQRVFDAVEGFPAMKLYLWYPHAWWRPTISAIRTVTDMPVRKVFYLDNRDEGPATLLAMYTDGRDVEPWLDLAGSASEGSPAPPAMLAEVQRCVREMHLEVGELPDPIGSALMHWGADPHEVGWHFWRAGAVSDDILGIASQPEPSLPIYLAGEAFSRRQSWVEGALESADAALGRVLSGTAP